MFHSRTLLFALTLCPLASLPLQAQPQTEQAKAVKAGQDEQIARTAWRDLQKETSRLELSEPAQAIEAYQQFYQASGNRYPDIAVAVTSRIAQLWGRGLKNPTKAGEIYAWALEQWGETPYKERLQREAAAMAKLGGVVPIVTVEPVGIKPLTVAPLASAGMAVRVGLQVTLAEISAKRLTVQQAHERGSLTVDDALHLLDGVGAWGNLAGGDGKTRRELAMLVVAQDPKQLETPDQLSPNVRLWIGEALGEGRDARSVSLLESLLSESKAQKPLINEKDVVRAFVTTEHLTEYYNNTGQTEKAVQTWLEVPNLFEGASLSEKNQWMIPEAFLLAGRSYNRIGETEKARALYVQVPQYGSGWISALSLYEQVQPLMNQGKIKEAYQLMSQPLPFTTDAKLGTVAQQSWLASFAYQMGDLDAAMKHSQTALDAGGDGSALNNASLSGLYGMARDTNTRAGGWKNQPIQTDTKEVVFQANPSQPDQPLYARFHIKTYGDKSVTASVDNPNIQARVLPINNWQRAGLNAHEEEMEVIVQSNSLNKFSDVPLVLSSATRGKTTTVRLSLREESPRPALTTGG